MNFTAYLKSFDYEERQEMKIKIPELIEALRKKEAILVDIRFEEEVQAWSVGFARNIPLNELPDRLDELDKNKLIVTACPHYDRASIARHFLTLQGFHSKYLVEGFLGLAKYLRGDKARDFIQSIT